jgi:hypothetical protein
MKKYIVLFAFLLLMSITFVYMGCKKDHEDKDQTAAANAAVAENLFNDVFKQVDNAAKQTAEAGADKVMQLDTFGCATVTITPFDTFSWPKTLTVDFGSTNCLCSDLRLRRGKVIAILSGRYRDSATVINVSLDQYYVNDYHVEGTKTITNLGHVGTYGGASNLKYSIVVANAHITPPGATTPILWNSTRTREWISGESTAWPNYPYWLDDVYLIDGSGSGTDVNGNSFAVLITSPLQIALNCRWIESGTVEITPQGLATRTVDFGSGNCDNQATVAINGIVFPFTMN